MSLRWNGSIEAKQQADEAYKMLKCKKKRRNKKQSRKMRPPVVSARKWLPCDEYLATEWWKWRREDKIRSVGRICQRCRSLEKIQVHHTSYDRLWAELNSDLEVLCRKCHEYAHELDIQAVKHISDICKP